MSHLCALLILGCSGGWKGPQHILEISEFWQPLQVALLAIVLCAAAPQPGPQRCTEAYKGVVGRQPSNCLPQYLFRGILSYLDTGLYAAPASPFTWHKGARVGSESLTLLKSIGKFSLTSIRPGFQPVYCILSVLNGVGK